MTTKVSREQAFSVLATNFSISPSTSGYTLQISADGINYTNLFAVGANVTRMVTGVASGSYYKLAGNTDTDIIVNWQAQCNDGQGGGGGSYVLPAATQSTLGGIKVGDGLSVTSDGTLSAEGGSGVVFVNSLSDAKAAAAEVGTLVGVYKEEGLTFYQVPINTNFKSDKILVDGDTDFSNARINVRNGSNSSTSVTLGRTNGKWTKLDGRSFGVWYLDGEELGNNVTGEYDGNVLTATDNNRHITITFTKDAEGNWVGTLSGDNNPYFLKIDNFNGTNAFKYEGIDPMVVGLYVKTSGGTVAHWQGYANPGQTEPFEIIYDDLYDFTTFCDGKIMFSLKYRYGGDTRYAFLDAANQSIILYSDSAKTIEVTRVVYLGPAVRFDAQQYGNINNVWVEWKEDSVYFYNKRGDAFVDDLIDFHTEGVHFSRITDPTKATASDLGLGTGSQTGFPIWNNEGIIIGRDSEKITKGLQINYGANTYSNMTNVVCTSGENYMPSRMYVPTAAGTQGQVLTFDTVNTAPVWATMIKSVQITSAAYEALVQAGTTDPNVLYLIVD